MRYNTLKIESEKNNQDINEIQGYQIFLTINSKSGAKIPKTWFLTYPIIPSLVAKSIQARFLVAKYANYIYIYI